MSVNEENERQRQHELAVERIRAKRELAAKGKLNVLPSSCPPRGLSRIQSAAYIGVSTTTFDTLVKRRDMPQPKRIGSRNVWDRLALDEAFSVLDERYEADRDEDYDWSL